MDLKKYSNFKCKSYICAANIHVTVTVTTIHSTNCNTLIIYVWKTLQNFSLITISAKRIIWLSDNRTKRQFKRSALVHKVEPSTDEKICNVQFTLYLIWTKMRSTLVLYITYCLLDSNKNAFLEWVSSIKIYGWNPLKMHGWSGQRVWKLP